MSGTSTRGTVDGRSGFLAAVSSSSTTFSRRVRSMFKSSPVSWSTSLNTDQLFQRVFNSAQNIILCSFTVVVAYFHCLLCTYLHRQTCFSILWVEWFDLDLDLLTFTNNLGNISNTPFAPKLQQKARLLITLGCNLHVRNIYSLISYSDTYFFTRFIIFSVMYKCTLVRYR